jgi:oligopeptide transport system substrate-binding protein
LFAFSFFVVSTLFLWRRKQMSNRKFFASAMGVLAGASMLLSACGTGATPTPQVIIQTQVQIVEGTPVVKEVLITATPAPEDPKPAADKVLRINLGTWPDVIDPQKSSFVNEIAHLKLVYEGLTKFNTKLETVPGAAEKWEYSDDLMMLTFTLRKDLKYSDGTLLNAKRYEYAIHRNINPETAGEYASITDEIAGAPEWRACDSATEGACEAAAAVVAESVKATHADGTVCADYEDAACDTLAIMLSKPAPYFHTIMGIWVAYPAKQELIEEGGEDWWTSSKYQIGNGPMVWKTMEPAVRSLFTPNENYWGGVAKVSIEYSYITESQVAFAAYQNDEFDIVGSAAEDFDTIEGSDALKAQHLVYAGSCTSVIKLGLEGVYKDPNGVEFESPFKDPKVREAFFYAFDAEGWTRDVDANLSTPTWTWIPPGYPGYDAEANATPQFDPERAKKALAESTYGGPDALNALGLKLTYGQSARNQTRSEWLVANYKENLGIDIALDPVDSTTFTAITKDPATFPLLARQGWCADYPDPQNWLSVYWRSDTTFASRQGWKNEEFDALVNAADIESDPAKRAELYMEAQRLLLSQYPSAFGYNNKNHYLVKPWVKGITTTPQDSGWPGEQDILGIDIDTSMLP